MTNLNTGYLSTNRGIIKILQVISGFITCSLLCANWYGGKSCFYEGRLGYASGLNFVIVIINIVFFFLNFLNVAVAVYRMERLYSVIGVILFIMAFGLMIWYLVEYDINHGQLIAATVFIGIQMVLFIWDWDEQSKPLINLTRKHFIRIVHRKLYIQCQQKREDGQKFFKIYVSKRGDGYYLPDILVPQDAYKFVDAWDKVIRQLPMEEPTHPEGDESPMILATQIVAPAQHYQFEISAWHKKVGAWHFHIQSVPMPTSEEHKESKVYFPFSALPWLRQQMVRMLVEHDGSEQIGEMPAIPEWATRAAPKIKQQKQQPPNVEQEQVKEKKADDAENCPYSCSGCTKEEKCWRCTDIE